MTTPPERNYVIVVLISGLILSIGVFWVGALSSRFEYGSPMLERPHALLVSILMGCGAAYLVAVFALQRISIRSTGLTIAILAIGLLPRGAMLLSDPIQEDDFYRYLWDGAVVANGHNPYPIVPESIAQDEALAALAMESGDVHSRVNHADLTTVYPPVAQATFALAHLMKPWSLGAWRAVLLLFDVATLLLVLYALRTLGRPLHWAAIYWWNPVLIKETFNSAHMDLVVLPFALILMLFVIANKPGRAGVAFMLAVGAKLWPVMLSLLAVRAIKATPRQWAVAAAVTLLLAILLAMPVLAAVSLGDRSGFRAYGDRWEMNDALFMVFAKGAELATGLLGFEDDAAGVVARGAVFIALIAWTLRFSLKAPSNPQDIWDRSVLIIAAIFMLSPTQFPWYYVWIVPFLALSPRPSMLVLSAMLPMYYLRFHFDARDNVQFFHNGLVWIEYAPIFILALWEARTRWRPKTLQEST